MKVSFNELFAEEIAEVARLVEVGLVGESALTTGKIRNLVNKVVARLVEVGEFESREEALRIENGVCFKIEEFIGWMQTEASKGRTSNQAVINVVQSINEVRNRIGNGKNVNAVRQALVWFDELVELGYLVRCADFDLDGDEAYRLQNSLTVNTKLKERLKQELGVSDEFIDDVDVFGLGKSKWLMLAYKRFSRYLSADLAMDELNKIYNGMEGNFVNQGCDRLLVGHERNLFMRDMTNFKARLFMKFKNDSAKSDFDWVRWRAELPGFVDELVKKIIEGKSDKYGLAWVRFVGDLKVEVRGNI